MRLAIPLTPRFIFMICRTLTTDAQHMLGTPCQPLYYNTLIGSMINQLITYVKDDTCLTPLLSYALIIADSRCLSIPTTLESYYSSTWQNVPLHRYNRHDMPLRHLRACKHLASPEQMA